MQINELLKSKDLIPTKLEAVIACFVIVLFMTSNYLDYLDKKSLIHIKEQSEILSLVAKQVFATSQSIPNRNITIEVATFLAGDSRLEQQLYNGIHIIPHNYKNKTPSIETEDGTPINITGKDGEIYVQFVGMPAEKCENIEFVTCP